MAVAVFEKGQRVFVRPMGCWARVERVVPQWVKGVEAPMRVHYDLGFGREFSATELYAPDGAPRARGENAAPWRVGRVHGAGLAAKDGAAPTLPAVFTEDGAWGGWRIEASEYARDPERFEHQARMIAAAPQLYAVVEALAALDDASAIPEALAETVAQARSARRAVFGVAEPESMVAAE